MLARGVGAGAIRRVLRCTLVPRRWESVPIHWKDKHGVVRTTDAEVGWSLLSVAHKYGIELEGACEGVCACSTCHVILPDEVHASLPEPSEEEEDMLDQAFGLTPTSRLGCQITVEPSMAGMTVRYSNDSCKCVDVHHQLELPAATRNFYVDGHVPKPH